MLSKTFRKGGKLAIRIPTESSVAAQIVRLTLSQVGSWVSLRVLSSTVLKIEHNVALESGSAYCFPHRSAFLHQSQGEDDSHSPLCPLWQLDAGQIQNRCDDVHNIRNDVGDTLRIRQDLGAFVPTASLHRSVPVCFKRYTVQLAHQWQYAVEHCDHKNRDPDNDRVDLGEFECKQVCADRPLEQRDSHQIHNLSNPYEITVS